MTLFALRRTKAKRIEAGGTGNGSQVVVPSSNESMTARETIAGDMLASLTTPIWNTPSKAWTGGAPMAASSLNRRMTMRLGPSVAFAQIGICGFDGTIELEALRLYGLPGEAPALPVGTREFQAEVSWDLPSLAPGITSLLDVTIANCWVGNLADAALASSTRFIELYATAWTINTVRVMVRNIPPGATFDLAAATLSVVVMKRQVP